jgi:hypothetical protein
MSGFRLKLHGHFFKLVVPLLLVVNSACTEDNVFEVNLSEVPEVQVDIKRYEQAGFEIPPDSFMEKFPELQDQFPVFLDGDINDTMALLQLRSFFMDPHMKELYQQVSEKYPDLEALELEFNQALRYLYFHFPELPHADVYTYISGLDFKYPTKFIGGSILIGLDMYLGNEYQAYKLSGFPNYRTRWSVKECIVPDAMNELAAGLMKPLSNDANLLEQMIYQGKRLYFTHSMLPQLSDSILFHYGQDQVDWVKKNQGNIYGYLIENQLLYTTDKRVVRKFTDDGPFTDLFSKKSPPRLAWYLGYQMVYAFMHESDYSLSELLLEENAQKILKISRYKPEI